MLPDLEKNTQGSVDTTVAADQATGEDSIINTQRHRPTDLDVPEIKGTPSSKPTYVTASLSSPVLDKVDCSNEYKDAQESISLPLRAASVPAETLHSINTSIRFYAPAHRRLKAMYGKERFRSGEET